MLRELKFRLQYFNQTMRARTKYAENSFPCNEYLKYGCKRQDTNMLIK